MVVNCSQIAFSLKGAASCMLSQAGSVVFYFIFCLSIFISFPAYSVVTYNGTYGMANTVFNNCTSCHSSGLSGAARNLAPTGVNYNTYGWAKSGTNESRAVIRIRAESGTTYMPTTGALSSTLRTRASGWRTGAYVADALPEADTYTPATIQKYTTRIRGRIKENGLNGTLYFRWDDDGAATGTFDSTSSGFTFSGTGGNDAWSAVTSYYTMTNLQCGQLYGVTAWARYWNGSAYIYKNDGDNRQFTTLACPTYTTSSISSVTEGVAATKFINATDLESDYLTFSIVGGTPPGMSISNWDANTARINYTAPQGVSNYTTNFIVRFNDGTKNYDKAYSITVVANNDAPSISNWTLPSRSYTENTNNTAVILDSANGTNISDVDHTKFKAANINFEAGFPARSGDALFCPSPSVSGITCIGNGTTSLSFSSTTFNNRNSFETAFEKIKFSNSLNNPSTATRKVRIRVQDDGNVWSDYTSKNVSVFATNDRPTSSNDSITATEDQDYIFSNGDFVFSDPDGHTLASVIIESLPVKGDLKYNGVNITTAPFTAISIGLLRYRADSNENGNSYATFQFEVKDNSASSNVSIGNYQMTVNVNAANDRPTSSSDSITATEDQDYIFSSGDFVFSDPDGHTLASVVIESLPVKGNLKYNGVNITSTPFIATTIGLLRYRADSNENGSSYATFQFEVKDNSGSLNTSAGNYQMTVNVNAENDRPTSISDSITATEDQDYIFSNGDFVFSDPDSHAFASVVIESLPFKGDLKYNGVNITSTPFTATTIGLLRYRADSNENGNSYATFQFEVKDSSASFNTSVGNYQMTVNVNAVNDKPTSQSDSITTNEDTDYFFDSTDFVVNDNDGHTLASVRIESLPLNGDLLDNGSLVVSASASVPHIVTVGNLTTLAFRPDSNTSGASYTSFKFDIVDTGSTNATSTGDYTMTVNVDSVNDRPTSNNDFINATEDVDYNFTVGEFVFNDNDGDTLQSLRVESLPLSGTLKYNGTPITSTPFTATNINLLAFRADNNDNGSNYTNFQFEVMDSSGSLNLSTGDYIMTVNVGAINDAPTLNTNADAGVEELQSVLLSNGNLSATDVDDNNTSLIYTVTAIPANGLLKKDAATINISDSFTQGDINTGRISYTQTSNAGSPTLDNFIFDLDDAQGAGPTGQIFTINISLNSNPTVSVGGTLNYNEDDVATAISSVTVGDADNDQITGATVQITGGFQSSEDVLSFNTQNGISGTYLSGTMTLTGSTSVANYQTALASVAYNNSLQNPTTAPRTVTYIVTDDFGLSSTGATATINVSKANDRPTSSNDSISAAEDTDYVFASGDFVFDDIDGHTFVSVVVESLPLSGLLKYNNVTITGGQIPFTATNIGLLAFRTDNNGNGNNYANFQFEVKDSSGSQNVSAGNYTMTVNVGEVNDAPAVDTNSNATVDELETVILSSSNLSSSDAEDANTSLTYTVTAAPANGVLKKGVATLSNGDTFTQGDINASQVSYTQTNNTGNPASDGFTFSLKDAQDAGPTGQGFSIDITANSNPTVSAGGTLNYNEDDVATAISNVTVGDADNDQIAGATVQITGGFQSSEDILSFSTQNGISGTYLSGTMTLTGSTSVVNYQTALASVAYNNSLQNPTTAPRTVTYIVTDDFGLSSTGATATINVSSDNDAPTLTNNVQLPVLELGTSVLTNTQLLADDVDDVATNLTYTVTTLPTRGEVRKNDVALLLNGTFTQADINAGNIKYANTIASQTSDSFLFKVEDDDNAGPSGLTFNISISQNAVPTITAGGTLNYSENDVATVIDNGIAVVDTDGDNIQGATVQITGNFQAIEDTLGFVNQNGISGVYNSGTLTLTGTTTVANYQSALASVTYINSSEDPSTSQRTVSYIVSDTFGNSSTGATALVNVAAANDAPIAADKTVATIEDASLNILAADFNYADDDSADTLQSVTIVSTIGVGKGSLKVGVSDVSNGSVVNVTDLAGNLVFTPAANEFGNPDPYTSFTFRVNDGTALSVDTYAMSINVSSDNDAPTLDVNAGLTAKVNDVKVLTSSVLLSTDIEDGASGVSYTVTQLPTKGTLSLPTSFTQQDVIDGLVTYTAGALSGGDSFMFDVGDQSGAGPTAQTFTITISDNDPPAIVAGDTLNFTENQVAQFIDTTISISDSDNTDMKAASVQITGNFASGEDVLACPAPVAGITCDDSVVGTLSFASATNNLIADYESVLASVTYVNNSEDPNELQRTVTYTVMDDFGNVSSGGTAFINVEAQNDAPTADDNLVGVSTDEDTPIAINVGDFNFDDVDSADSLQSVTVVTTIAAGKGSLKVGAGDVSNGTVIDVIDLVGNLVFTPAEDEFGNPDPYTSFTFRVNDGTALSVSSYTMNLNVAAINDAPEITNNVQLPVLELGTSMITNTQLLADDVDDVAANITYTITTLPTQGEVRKNDVTLLINGTFTQADINAGNIKYANTIASQTSDNFLFKVEDDDNAGPSGLTFNISISQNAVPTITAGGTLNYSENDVATVIDNGIAVVDTDGDNIQGATVQITGNFQATEDTLGFVNQNGISGVYNSGTLTLTGTTTVANYQTALASVTYFNNSEAPDELLRTVTYTVTDVFNNISTGDTASIDVSAENDLPTSADANVALDEDIVFNFTGNEFAFNDIDGDSLTKIQITALPAKGVLKLAAANVTLNQEILVAQFAGLNYKAAANENGNAYATFAFKVNDGTEYSTAANTITINVAEINDPATLDTNTGLTNVSELGVMVITAAVLSASDIENTDPADLTYTVTTPPTKGVLSSSSFSQQDILDGTVTYTHNSPGMLSDNFTFKVEDPAPDNEGPVGQVFNIAIVQNAKPVVTAGAILDYTENAAATVIDNTITVNDADGDDIKSAVISISVGHQAAEDLLAFVNQNGISGIYDSGTGILMLTGVATAADYQAAIRSITYVNNSEDPDTTARNVQYIITDAQDNVSDAVISTILVSKENDVPVIDIHSSVTVTTVDVAVNISAGELHVVDIESPDNQLVYTIISQPAGGEITLSAAPLLPGATFTQQDITDGNLAYITSSCAFTSDSFSVMVKDGGNAESLTEVFTINTIDTDSDGMNDCYENRYPLILDPNDPTDANEDSDQDGLTNLEEFQQGKDPEVDDAGPEITAPADILIDATGYLTQVDIGEATAVDLKDGEVPVSYTIERKVSGVTVEGDSFGSGAYVITWTAEDSVGNAAAETQTLDIRPLANLSFDQYSGEGVTVSVSLMLSGEAPEYPASFTYSLSGTADILDYVFETGVMTGDGNVSGGVITINSGNSLIFTVDVLNDAVVEVDETVIVDISNPVNAALGMNVDHVITITENNVAPTVTLEANQLNHVTSTVYQLLTEDVTVVANAVDANGDTLSYDWSGSSAEVKAALSAGVTTLDADLVFNPDLLTSGKAYLIDVVVSDDATTPASTHSSIYVYVKPITDVPTLLVGEDTDNDGVDDDVEGYGDTDQDGIPDFLDNSNTPEVIVNQHINLDAALFIQVDAGLTIKSGPIAIAAGKSGVLVTNNDLKNYGGINVTSATDTLDTFTNNGGYFNFEVSGLTPLQDVAHIVLPLQTFILADSTYRKYWPGIGWVDFVVDDKNKVSSAPGIYDSCPAPGSNLYVEGLAIFTYCIQLTIEDGGPNDLDGEKNGRIIDPGGVGDELEAEVSSDAGVKKVSNGGLNQWFIGMFLLILYWRNRKYIAWITGESISER